MLGNSCMEGRGIETDPIDCDNYLENIPPNNRTPSQNSANEWQIVHRPNKRPRSDSPTEEISQLQSNKQTYPGHNKHQCPP